MKISIVMAYVNRKNLFYHTLKSIVKTKHKNYEIIVVDDASEENERIEDLTNEFNFLKVIRLEKKDRWYNSAIVPWNIGIFKAKGSIIILQNPECLHVHDILSCISNKVNSTNYVSISTYSLNTKLTEDLPLQIKKVNFIDYFKSLPQQSVNWEGSDNDYVGWYNHSKYRPTHYPFCAAMTKKNIKKLGGFDIRYAMGIGFEDDDLIDRIGKLGLNKIIIDDISVIHQYHLGVYDLKVPEYKEFYVKNANLLKITKNEKGYKTSNIRQ